MLEPEDILISIGTHPFIKTIEKYITITKLKKITTKFLFELLQNPNLIEFSIQIKQLIKMNNQTPIYKSGLENFKRISNNIELPDDISSRLYWKLGNEIFNELLKNNPVEQILINRFQELEYQVAHDKLKQKLSAILEKIDDEINEYTTLEIPEEDIHKLNKNVQYFEINFEILSNPKMYLKLGNLKALEKKYEEALFYYNVSLILNNQEALSRANKGFLYSLLDESLSRANKGFVYSKLDEPVLALEYYQKALHINEKIAGTWSNMGNTYKELLKYNEAEACYDRAISLEKTNYIAWFNKGTLLHKLFRFEEAIDCFKRATFIKPNYVKAWLNKGDSLCCLKKFNQAMKCYDYILQKLDEYYISALYNKSSLLNSIGKCDEGIFYFERARVIENNIRCILCRKYIFDNKIKECECGELYHINCYNSLVSCTKCGKEFRKANMKNIKPNYLKKLKKTIRFSNCPICNEEISSDSVGFFCKGKNVHSQGTTYCINCINGRKRCPQCRKIITPIRRMVDMSSVICMKCFKAISFNEPFVNCVCGFSYHHSHFTGYKTNDFISSECDNCGYRLNNERIRYNLKNVEKKPLLFPLHTNESEYIDSPQHGILIQIRKKKWCMICDRDISIIEEVLYCRCRSCFHYKCAINLNICPVCDFNFNDYVNDRDQKVGEYFL